MSIFGVTNLKKNRMEKMAISILRCWPHWVILTPLRNQNSFFFYFGFEKFTLYPPHYDNYTFYYFKCIYNNLFFNISILQYCNFNINIQFKYRSIYQILFKNMYFWMTVDKTNKNNFWEENIQDYRGFHVNSHIHPSIYLYT